LDDNIPLRTIKNNWVLVEFSFAGPPINAKEKIFALQIKGYQPILAHPERYLYFDANKKFFDELKDTGCYFQVNILSFSGYYGKGPLELAQYLSKKQYIDFLGTDLHHYRHLELLQSATNLMDPVKAALDTGKILNSFL
jgi:tyrosine-protein phosphatase YwqE